MPIRLLTSGGGTTTIQPTTSASSVTLTVPSVNANVVTTGDTASVTQAMLASNLAGTGPCFRAYKSAGSQSLSSGVFTKLTLTSTDFNLGSCYDTTNSKFLPTVAGYYNIIASVGTEGTSSLQRFLMTLYKNGNQMGNWMQDIQWQSSGGSQGYVLNGSQIVYLNGSTDYIELYSYMGGTSLIAVNTHTTLSGFMVRAA